MLGHMRSKEAGDTGDETLLLSGVHELMVVLSFQNGTW
jgi:hypothetical protein